MSRQILKIDVSCFNVIDLNEMLEIIKKNNAKHEFCTRYGFEKFITFDVKIKE